MANDSKPSKEHGYQNVSELFRVRRRLKLHHKILYIAMVFVGLNLCWYGVWTTIEKIPFLNIPLIAILAGIGLLILTDKINDLT